MRIGFVHPSYPGSEGTGATHTATQIVKSLVDRGHELDVFCVEQPPRDVRPVAGVNIELIGDSRIPHTNIALNRAIRGQLDEFDRYDVVSSYLTRLIPAMNAVAEKTTAASVVTLNAYGGVCPKNDLRFMDVTACTDNSPGRCLPCIARTSGGSDRHSQAYRAASRLGNYGLIKRVDPHTVSIDGFHALSDHVKSTYAGFGFPEERISVLPNPVDEAFCIPHQSDFAEPYRLLYVGYLEPHKGVDVLPEIMTRLEDADYGFELTVVGDGGMRSELEQSVRDAGITDVVDFRGHVPYDELPSIYAHHDVFVYPGVWEEPFGRVFLEAMGAKTPVVATDVGAADEILGQAGIVVEPSAGALADGILSVIRDDVLDSLSASARTEIERFGQARLGSEFEEFYTSLASSTD